MTDYLSYTFDWSQQDAAATFDEQPLWTAMAGLLLLEHVPLRAASRLLDVGTGTGFPLLELAQRLGPASRAVGLDPWGSALRRATYKANVRNITNAQVVLGDAVAMPFPRETFDVVVSNLGLNNFADAPASIVECVRVVRPDGLLAISTNLQGTMREFYAVFREVLRDFEMSGAAATLESHVEHRATTESVRRLFGSAGVTAVRTEQRDVVMRYADGTAFLNHGLIKGAFLPDWKPAVSEGDLPRVFEEIESRLNKIAAAEGELRITVPLAYIEARKR